MSTVLVRYRIARTGQPVPTDEPAPPDYVPWPHAPITWTRIEGDYGPGIVRPRDSLTTRADEAGEGSVWLAPGRYRITLPSRDARDVTVSAEPVEIDLSALLAGGGVEPDDPQYPTLAAYVVDQIGVALEDQLDAIDEAVETAGESAATAQEARDAAVEAQTVTEAARDAAIAAQGLAEGARDDAEGYATTAGTARDQAVAAQGAAESAASAASSHASAAAGSASAAEGSASSASGSASAAAGSATAAQTARQGAEDARDAAQGYAEDAQQAAQATAADRLAVSQDRQAIESEQAARLAAIQTAGDTQVQRVEDEGDTQTQRVIDAGDALAIVVPDPAPQPDGRVLTTWGGALAYAPDLAAAVAVAGASPGLVTIYETGRRAVTSATSAYGRQTDSGHIWEAVPGSAASPTLAYNPQGYLVAGSSPTDRYLGPHESGVSLVGSGVLSAYRAVGMVGYNSQAHHWSRRIVVGWEDADNYIAIEVAAYVIRAILRLGGQTQVLGEWGNLNQGDAPHFNVWHIRGLIQYSHANYGSAAMVVYYRGAEVIRAPLDTVPISDGAPVGIAADTVTHIYSLTAWSLRP